MTRAWRRVLIGTALVTVAACIELGPSGDGVVSISNLRLPYPSVVIGDLMRDSLGAPAPLSLIAFGADGQPIPGEPLAFVALDTTISVDADGTVHGLFRDSVGGRVVGGAGGLQTPPHRIIVTIAPTDATKSPDETKVQFVNTEPDSLKQTNWSEPLVLTVTGSGQPAQGYVVLYEVVEMPDAVNAGTTTAYIGDDAGKPMPRDTTDTKGIASRRVILRQSQVAEDVRRGDRPDSAIVRATVKYLGSDVSGSPVEFIVPVSRKP